MVDLLGPGTVVDTKLEKDTAYNNLTAVAASSISLSALTTEQFETSALALSDSLMKDTARRQAVVGCTPAGATDEACMRSFITSFGLRAFRRPLVAEEVELYAGVGINAMKKLSDFWGGARYALAGLLQSPNFIYRVELGAPGMPARPLDGYELASRLSYLLWSSTPDDTLLAAAQSGSLASPTGLTEQATRLMESPRAEQALTANLLSQMLRLGELEDLALSPDSFPAARSATLAASMQTETQSVLRDLVFARNADYRELYTSNKTFVNAELAALYGVQAPAGGGFGPVTLPENGPRAGYLGHASFLALTSHPTHTSPTHRGLFIIGTLMCDSIQPPPEGVIAELAEKDKNKTLREQLALHQTSVACSGCHALMDPMGLALEHFDAVGAYRENDRGMPLDVTGSVGGVAFNGARELGQALANSAITAENNTQTADCLVRNLYRAATGHLEAQGEEALVTALSSAFAADGFRVKAALARLITSDGFRFVGQPESMP